MAKRKTATQRAAAYATALGGCPIKFPLFYQTAKGSWMAGYQAGRLAEQEKSKRVKRSA